MIKKLKEEIVKIASEENLDVAKLNEYTRMYERLKMYEVYSVQQLPPPQNGYEFGGIGGYPPVRVHNDTGNTMDIIKEAIYAYNNQPKDKIVEYMTWVGFLKDNKEFVEDAFLISDIIKNAEKLMRDKLCEIKEESTLAELSEPAE